LDFRCWVKEYKEFGLERSKEKRGGAHYHHLTPEQDIVVHSFQKDCNYTQVT